MKLRYALLCGGVAAALALPRHGGGDQLDCNQLKKETIGLCTDDFEDSVCVAVGNEEDGYVCETDGPGYHSPGMIYETLCVKGGALDYCRQRPTTCASPYVCGPGAVYKPCSENSPQWCHHCDREPLQNADNIMTTKVIVAGAPFAAEIDDLSDLLP